MGIIKNIKNILLLCYSNLLWIKKGKPTLYPECSYNFFITNLKNIKMFKLLEELRAIYPKIMTKQSTVDYVLNNKCSVARLGDVELEIAMNNHSPGWENPYSPKLGEMMRETLKVGTTKSILVCLNCIPNENDYCSLYMRYYYLTKFSYKKISKLFNVQNIYGDALAFRITSVTSLDKVKKLWEGRKVLFVVGKDGTFEFENELFNNITEKAFIYGPCVNALCEYTRILAECLQYNKDWLIYLALGSTATVLACDLSQRGYQALDLGKLDVSFRFMKEGKDQRDGIQPGQKS